MTPLVFGLALTLAAPAPKKSDEPPPAKLEGDWVVESFEGPPKQDTPPGSITMRISDGKLDVMDSTRKGGKAEEAEYTADLTKKPATIDIKPKAGGGPAGGPDRVVLGILEIKGDTLTLCFGRDAATRPTEFKANMEKGIVVIHLKRIKPEK
jgi:uncharacterized protein (TIGR03067 family)